MNCPTLLLLAMIVMAPVRLLGQLVAGEVPTGHTLIDYVIHLEPSADFTEAWAEFDVDCDGQNDFKIVLKRGAPYMDFPNRLCINPLADSITICAADTAPLCTFNHAYLYPEGQTMSCALPFSMLVDTSIVIGDYVTYTCGGTAPQGADSTYIRYAKEVNGVMNEGWILLSFDILSSDPDMPIDPWADVHAAVGVCTGMGIKPYTQDVTRIKFHPNPAPEGFVNWSCPVPLLSVEVHDAMGRLVLDGAGGNSGQLDLSGRQGAFFLLCRTAFGPLPVEKLVVY